MRVALELRSRRILLLPLLLPLLAPFLEALAHLRAILLAFRAQIG